MPNFLAAMGQADMPGIVNQTISGITELDKAKNQQVHAQLAQQEMQIKQAALRKQQQEDARLDERMPLGDALKKMATESPEVYKATMARMAPYLSPDAGGGPSWTRRQQARFMQDTAQDQQLHTQLDAASTQDLSAKMAHTQEQMMKLQGDNTPQGQEKLAALKAEYDDQNRHYQGIQQRTKRAYDLTPQGMQESGKNERANQALETKQTLGEMGIRQREAAAQNQAAIAQMRVDAANERARAAEQGRTDRASDRELNRADDRQNPVKLAKELAGEAWTAMSTAEKTAAVVAAREALLRPPAPRGGEPMFKGGAPAPGAPPAAPAPSGQPPAAAQPQPAPVKEGERKKGPDGGIWQKIPGGWRRLPDAPTT